MRTTLDIDDDVLITVRSVARRERKTLSKVVSDLARSSLAARTSYGPLSPSGRALAGDEIEKKLGELGIIPYVAPGGTLVTEALVNALREQEGV